MASKSIFLRSKQRLLRLTSSTYLRGIALLSGGQASAALIPIFSAPVLGRLYSPNEYALLALFFSLSQIAAAFASLQYHHAIIAERSDNRALSALWICIILNVSVSLALLVAVCLLFLTSNEFYTGFQNGWWFLFVPVSVLSNSFAMSVSTFANRLESYKLMTSIQIGAAILSAVISISLGLLNWGSNGLMTALIVSQLAAAVLYMSWLLRHVRSTSRSIDHPAILKISFLRNRRFPSFTMPGVMLSAVSMQIPIFALNYLGAQSALGAFNRARSLVSMPITLMGQAVGQGFRARASHQFRETGTCRSLMLKSIVGMSLIGIIPFGILFIWGEAIITLYLGPEWEIAGKIATVLSPMLYLRFISTPFVGVFQFTGKQRRAFQLSVLYSIFIVASILYSVGVGMTALEVITVFSCAYALVYAVHLVASILVS